MNAQRGSGMLRYSCTVSLTSALDGGRLLTPRPGRFTSEEETRCAVVQEGGRAWGPVWRDAKNLASSGLDPGSHFSICIVYYGRWAVCTHTLICYELPLHEMPPARYFNSSDHRSRVCRKQWPRAWSKLFDMMWTSLIDTCDSCFNQCYIAINQFWTQLWLRWTGTVYKKKKDSKQIRITVNKS